MFENIYGFKCNLSCLFFLYLLVIYVTCFSSRFFFYGCINRFIDWFPEVANHLPTCAFRPLHDVASSFPANVHQVFNECVSRAGTAWLKVCPKSLFPSHHIGRWLSVLFSSLCREQEVISDSFCLIRRQKYRKHWWLLFWRMTLNTRFLFYFYYIQNVINISRLSLLSKIYLTYYYFSIEHFCFVLGYIFVSIEFVG